MMQLVHAGHEVSSNSGPFWARPDAGMVVPPRPVPASPLPGVSAYDALRLCAQVQFSAAEQIDASLQSFLRGMMSMACAYGARWQLQDQTQPSRRVQLAELCVGDWDGVAGELRRLSFSKVVRPGRVMRVELCLPDPAHLHVPVPVDTLLMTLNALGRWVHWLDMSHGPVNGQGAMPPHQRKVLLLMVTGLSEKQIAAHLDISTNTAHQYVTAIFRRYGVRNRPSLMARWLGDVADQAAGQPWGVSQG